MKRILVTGSEGFIGKALVKRLLEENHSVRGFDIPDGDIAGKDPLEKFLGDNIEYVFHLAGKTFVPDSWTDPYEFHRINVLGTLNVLEFCRKAGCGLTYVSSYVYGTPQYLPVDENHPVKAFNPYSQSKILAEEVVQFYKEFYNLGVCVLRPFNIYGPGQSENFLIPELIKKYLDPEIPFVEVKDIRPKRDFLYIDDFVDALVLSVTTPSKIFNVASGRSVSVQEILKIFSQIKGIDKPIQNKKIQRTAEIFDLYADINNINQIGWRPRISIQEGLKRCLIYWERNNN